MKEDTKTARYSICGVTLASNVPLPELLPHGSDRSDLCFTLKPPSLARREDPSWVHHALHSDGTRWLSLARPAGGYLLRFGDLADFTLSEDATQIECRPGPRTSPETIRHLFLDQVLPQALGHQGTLVLHAGAVADGDEAIAFIGETGWGKSTLTACFCRVGWSLLADDCLPLREESDSFLAGTSYPGVRLRPDALRMLFGAGAAGSPVADDTDKKRVDAGSMMLGVCSRRVPLKAVYLLDPPPRDAEEGTRITSVEAHEGLLIFLKYLFRLDPTDRGRLKAEFERLSRLTDQVPVRRLAFRRDLASLPAIVTAIRRDLESPARRIVRSTARSFVEPLRRAARAAGRA